ncbi:MAG: hypothetical protein ACHP6H_05370 [Legionellales bacterium]
MNGNTLKVCFLGIVGTLCLLLLILTAMAAIGKLPLENYGRLLGILGIPALFGMISQAFIHANIADSAQKGLNAPTTPLKPPQDSPTSPKSGQTIWEYLLLTSLLTVCIGCAVIVKHPCNMTITNAVYGGAYCVPGGCRGDLNYQANTEVCVGLGYGCNNASR